MLLARGLEEQALKLCSGPAPVRRSGLRVRGSEAFGVGAACVLGPEDRLFASDRYLSAHLARGLPPEDYLLRCLGGRRNGDSRDGAPSLGFASPGTELVDLAAGAALALQLRGAHGCAMTLVPGEAYAGGHCVQALRGAKARGLPLVIVVEAGPDVQISEPALADATDVEAVAAASRAAVDAARAGDGPRVVVCRPEAGGGERDAPQRELRRLACNSSTRELIAPLRRDVAELVDVATRRARTLRSAPWREVVGTAA